MIDTTKPTKHAEAGAIVVFNCDEWSEMGIDGNGNGNGNGDGDGDGGGDRDVMEMGWRS